MQHIVIYGLEARQKLVNGVNKLADAIKVTLGAKGRHVIISKNYRIPQVTKDGATIARDFELDDALENAGAQIVKQAALKTLQDAGDGTTTSTILAQAIIAEGMKKMAEGINPMELKQQIEDAVTVVCAKIKEMAIPVEGHEMIKQVASIAANNDEVIGELIANAYDKIGKDGVITIADSHSTETYITVANGMEIDTGLTSPHFANTAHNTCEYEDCKVLIYEKKLTNFTEIFPLVQKVHELGKPLIIMCDGIDGDAGGSLVVNKIKSGLKVCVVNLPSHGDVRKELIKDIHALTGGTITGPERGIDIKTIGLTQLGSLDKITVSKDSTLLVGKSDSKERTTKRIEELKELLLHADTTMQAVITQRIAKVSNGIAVIHVGGQTDVELSERKDRVDDAVRATRSALEEGIVAGGGICLMRTGKSILNGVENRPLYQIIENCGLVGNDIYDKITYDNSTSYGYNAKTGQYGDMIQMGVIDAAKVVRSALQNAASVATVILTCECIVAEETLKSE